MDWSSPQSNLKINGNEDYKKKPIIKVKFKKAWQIELIEQWFTEHRNVHICSNAGRTTNIALQLLRETIFLMQVELYCVRMPLGHLPMKVDKGCQTRTDNTGGVLYNIWPGKSLSCHNNRWQKYCGYSRLNHSGKHLEIDLSFRHIYFKYIPMSYLLLYIPTFNSKINLWCVFVHLQLWVLAVLRSWKRDIYHSSLYLSTYVPNPQMWRVNDYIQKK